VRGLVGERVALPVGAYLGRAHEFFGADAYRLAPTLLWLWHSDAALVVLCWSGAALALALDYRSTTPEERSGAWWSRTLEGIGRGPP
jgi:hypothetical protein